MDIYPWLNLATAISALGLMPSSPIVGSVTTKEVDDGAKFISESDAVSATALEREVVD